MIAGKKIVSYNPGSASAKALSEELGIKRIKHEGKPIKVDVLINWGCSNIPGRIVANAIINRPEHIRNASNKLQAFKLLEEHVSLPPWTESRHTASGWLPDSVVCRTVLNGHSGNGIVIATQDAEIVEAPLYTKYVKKELEYRLHVFKEQVFFVQKKARKLDVPDDQVNWQVRNHQNGFIYANKDVEIEELYKEIAVKAVKALGLDFGAVDLIITKSGQPYVLEVNTAPGVQGLTLQKYTDIFKNL